MKTTDFFVGYRPVRLGLLVRDSNLEDLLSAIELNTLLWGGIFNPIVPVGESNQLLVDNLINSLQVDFLLPMSQEAELLAVPKKYSHLDNHIARVYGIYQEDWKTKKKVLSYADINHLIDFFWEKEFKHAEKGASNCVSVSWDSNDKLKNMLAAEFGFFGDQGSFKRNFYKNYLDGLRAKRIAVQKSIPSILSSMIPPIEFTKSRLSYSADEYREAGLFVGDPNDFHDLVNFWNVRASGRGVSFFPFNAIKRAKKFAQTKIDNLNKVPNRYHDDYSSYERLYIYHTSIDFESCKKISSIFKSKRPFSYYNVGDQFWNKKYFKTSEPRFDDENVTAMIDNDGDGVCRVTIPLPPKPLSSEIFETQQYVITVRALSEYSFGEYTLSPPYLPDLNEFFRREISLGGDSVRVGRDRIGFIDHSRIQASINLYLLKKQQLLIKLFERAGLKTELSTAGRLANLIVKKMGGLEDCRVFQIRGVRELTKTRTKNIGWSDASKIVYKNGFQKYKHLFIEPRKKGSLNSSDVIQYLLKKDVLVPRQRFLYKLFSELRLNNCLFSCENCGHKTSISPKEFVGFKVCAVCNKELFMPLFISKSLSNSRRNWFLEKSEIFKKGTDQEGSVPVILTILQLNRILGHGHELPWVTALNLRAENSAELKCETDFAFLDPNSRFEGTEESRAQIAIGECKAAEEITDEDITNLCKVRERLMESGITCYLVFSKTSDSFLPVEIERFKKLEKEIKQTPILFTNTELESYMPYFEHPKEKELPRKHPFSFQDISFNSKAIYLS